MPSDGKVKYTLAIIPSQTNDEAYELVYLSSNKFRDDWQAGELKGLALRTGIPSLYKVDWYNANKEIMENVFTETTNDGFLMFRYSGVDSTRYIRLTPTKEPDKHVSESEKSIFHPLGSGMLISQTGYLLTCWHVVESVTTPKVVFSENTNTSPFETEVVFQDKSNDIAILKITDSLFTASTPTYGVSNARIAAGENVFTIGYPLTDIMGQSPKVSEGIISSTTGFQDDVTTFQMSAPVQPGNSGGPVFDNEGNLIGIDLHPMDWRESPISVKFVGTEEGALDVQTATQFYRRV